MGLWLIALGPSPHPPDRSRRITRVHTPVAMAEWTTGELTVDAGGARSPGHPGHARTLARPGGGAASRSA